MTLDEYEANVGMGRNGEFDGDEADGGACVGGGDDDDEIVIPGEAMTGYETPPRQAIVPRQPTSSNPITVTRSGGSNGLLDDGRTPSRWNKCRFKCQLCGKLSSEKRHVREHIVKIHGLTLQEYEATYGSCEIHTEYFVCLVCRAEVKHNLKNISLHLQNSHQMTANQYEDQYGRLPDSSTDQTSPIRGAVTPAAQTGPIIVDQGSAEDYGFGSHFMLDDDGQDDQYMAEPPAVQVNHSLGDSFGSAGRPPLTNPPKADVQNPKNKFCSPCNRDFNRRQAFVEHCRNVHRMNIKLASHKPPMQPQGIVAASTVAPAAASLTITPPGAANPGSYKCDYCPKYDKFLSSNHICAVKLMIYFHASYNQCDVACRSFSNRSNKNRHMLLSCEVAGPNARNSSGGNGVSNEGASQVTSKSSNGGFRESLKRLNSGDFIYDPQVFSFSR